MKKLFGALLALTLLTGVLPALGAQTQAGPPAPAAHTVIEPLRLTVAPGKAIELIATTTLTGPTPNQPLVIVSETWEGVDETVPAAETEVTLEDGATARAFVATAGDARQGKPGGAGPFARLPAFRHDVSDFLEKRLAVLPAQDL